MASIWRQQRRPRDAPQQLGRGAEGQHFAAGQGSFCRLGWRLLVGVRWASVALPTYPPGRAALAQGQLAALNNQQREP